MPGYLFRHRLILGIVAAALVGAVLVPVQPCGALPPAMTKENVQKKAVVITHDAKLFAKAAGPDGKKAEFMQVFFLLEGEAGTRVPVTYGPNDDSADGWLERSSFVEWNTLQMINFEPQSGRELARIFNDAGCAEKFGLSGAAACPELGSEPQRTGKEKDNYSLLVPVIQRDRDNYKGGFVRVTSNGPAVKPLPDVEKEPTAKNGTSRLGYDLVLVVDSTASMKDWFRPTTQALDTFLGTVRQQIGTGEMKTPFRVGLLFYRDRKVIPDCNIGFLFHWEAQLTDDIAAVSRALASANDASPCGSDEAAESVYDALSRAMQDPKWNDGHFKVVLLVGDAPPHQPTNKDKNPLSLDVDDITKMAEERNIRIMAFKLGLADETEFKALALSPKEAVRGRFRALEPNQTEYRNALLASLNEEWELLTKGNQAVAQGITQRKVEKDPKIFQKEGIQLDAYETPIIIANLPPGSASSGAPEFVQGWVPKKIKQKLAIGEYVFLSKFALTSLVNVIDTVAEAAQEGATEGGEAFIANLRNSLAAMLKVQPNELFRSGESLESMMEKAKILPFKTTVLSFTAEEVNAWKPAEFDRLNKILGEKTKALREYAQQPSNIHTFGDKPHVYVPRDLFP